MSTAERFDRGPYFIAIRRGLTLSLPPIMVDAVALLLRSPPTAGMRYPLLEAFGMRLDVLCDSVLAGTIGIDSLVALFGFADVLVQLHNQRAGYCVVNPAVAAMVVVSCFFTFIAPAADTSLMAQFSLGQGLFGTLVVASLGGTLFLKLCSIRRLRIPSHHLSNDLLAGGVLSVVLTGTLTILMLALLKTGMAWVGWLHFTAIVDPLLVWLYSAVSNSLLFGLGYETAVQVLWLFGIHGPNALYTVHQYVLEPAAQTNAAAVASGGQPPFISTYHSFTVLACMGGSGGTLSLILALFISGRIQRGRKMALVVMLPALFSANEPLLSGLPLVLNLVYAILSLLTPVVQILIAYAATVTDLMPKTSYPVAWTTSALFSDYVTTGPAWGAVVQLIGLVVGVAIYLPFARMADILSVRHGQDVPASLLQIAESTEVNLKGRRCLDLPGDGSRMAVALASDPESAIRKDGRIFLGLQPQVDCSTGHVFGAEALLHWQHPVLGRVAPLIVVVLADDIGQIDQLGLWILSLACQQRMTWCGVLPDDFVVAVNLSPRQLPDCRPYRDVLDVLRREGLSPTQLELEITESTMLLPDITAIGNLKQLREAGVEVALDDFGMGHTSLHYLCELLLDTVRIDRLLADVNVGSVNKHIVRSIANLGRTLNLSTVVEGVETTQQLQRLSALGCDRF